MIVQMFVIKPMGSKKLTFSTELLFKYDFSLKINYNSDKKLIQNIRKNLRIIF